MLQVDFYADIVTRRSGATVNDKNPVVGVRLLVSQRVRNDNQYDTLESTAFHLCIRRAFLDLQEYGWRWWVKSVKNF